MLDETTWPKMKAFYGHKRRSGSEGAGERLAFVLGKVRRYDLPNEVVESRHNRAFPELHAKLGELIAAHDPHFEYNAIQLNCNVQTNPHFDSKGNDGLSYCLALGDFCGGGLQVYPEGSDDGPSLCIQNKRKWVLYDGTKVLHGSAPLESGTRYALIFFKCLSQTAAYEKRLRNGTLPPSQGRRAYRNAGAAPRRSKRSA